MMALPFVLIRQTSAERFISRISPSDDWSTVNLEVPKNISAAEYDIKCSGDGLLCFCRPTTKFGDDEFVIWNLSTDTCQLLPPSDITYRPCGCSSRRCEREVDQEGFGLGREVSQSEDYKFVRFMCILNDDDDSHHNSSCHVAVYSSKTNSWKEHPFPFGFEDKYEISPRISHGAAISLNGFFYWTTSVDVILSFDLSSDTFSTLPFPDAPAPAPLKNWYATLLELDGSLGLMVNFTLLGLFSVWVYEGGGGGSTWTRKVNLDVRDRDRAVIEPLWLGKKTNNGEYLLLFHGYHGPYNDDPCSCCARRSEALVEYDYTRGEFTNIDEIPDDHTTKRMMIISPINVHVHVESTNMEEDDIDRISSLPDDIILTILSFLSLKEAAASTGLLSKRWSDLWRHAPNLNFQFAHHLVLRDEGKYVDCVNSVVGCYRAPALKEFNVSFHLNYSTRRRVTKWLKFAFSRRVEMLELNFLGLRRRASLLEKLLRLFKSTNLTSLCLKCVEVSGGAIGMVLRNCPLLERLIIKYAALTSDLEVCSGSLKRLDVQHCTGGISISINKGYAPNLTHLKIDSDPLIVIREPPKLLRYPQLVCSFTSSQITTLQFTIKGYLEKGFPEMPSLRVLIVTYHKRRHTIRPITCLLCASPNLEEFEIKHCRRSCIEQQQLGMGMSMDIEGVNNVCQHHYHRHLRIFKFAWFDVSDGDHLELMSYILVNCVALQKIILDIYEADSPMTSPSCAAALEYAKQLQSELPTHIHLIITFNYRQLV